MSTGLSEKEIQLITELKDKSTELNNLMYRIESYIHEEKPVCDPPGIAALKRADDELKKVIALCAYAIIYAD